MSEAPGKLGAFLFYQESNLLLAYAEDKRLVLQEPRLLFVRGFVGVAEVHEEEAFVVGRSGTIGQS